MSRSVASCFSFTIPMQLRSNGGRGAQIVESGTTTKLHGRSHLSYTSYLVTRERILSGLRVQTQRLSLPVGRYDQHSGCNHHRSRSVGQLFHCCRCVDYLASSRKGQATAEQGGDRKTTQCWPTWSIERRQQQLLTRTRAENHSEEEYSSPIRRWLRRLGGHSVSRGVGSATKDLRRRWARRRKRINTSETPAKPTRFLLSKFFLPAKDSKTEEN